MHPQPLVSDLALTGHGLRKGTLGHSPPLNLDEPGADRGRGDGKGRSISVRWWTRTCPQEAAKQQSSPNTTGQRSAVHGAAAGRGCCWAP